ncbi:MAG: HAMP domain-containing protein [Bdellovibrionales bacterium]|nr:HAMP domain-containing protein [Bdellovibrionales bacterium]
MKTAEPAEAVNKRSQVEIRGIWRILGLGVLFVGLVALAFSYIVRQVPSPGDSAPSSSHLEFFLLINLNIIVVMVLGFMVVKNIVKLLLDRRRRILGSRLRARLVAAFVGLSLIPTALLFLMAKGILERVLEEWFSPQVTASVDGAFDVAQHFYDSTEAQLYRNGRRVALELQPLAGMLEAVRAGGEGRDNAVQVIRSFLENERDEYGLFSIAAVDRDGTTLVRAEGPEARRALVDVPLPSTASLQKAWRGATVVVPEESLNSEFLRAYVPLYAENLRDRSPGLIQPTENASEAVKADQPTAVITATAWISPELIETLAELTSAHDDYRELRTYRRPLASNFTLTLVIVTLMIVFAAVWVGFYLARSLSIPIQLVAEGTQEIAQGNLKYRIPEVGDDELSILVRSFNTMTEDLEGTTEELIRRRRYMEAVLANVGVGVISVDRAGVVRTVNLAAAEMFNIAGDVERRQETLDTFFPSRFVQSLERILASVYEKPEVAVSETLTLLRGETEREILITATQLVGEQGVLGAVLLFDDVTELVSAQRMAAWREVARRIAHEIKNPLTPIQLSAQRLSRRFVQGKAGRSLTTEERELIDSATEMIVSQVETLRALVNEFSRFARMPKAQLKPTDLNRVLEETAKVYSNAEHGVEVVLELDSKVPRLDLDPDQIGRVLVNLIDNGIASVLSKREMLSSNGAQTETSASGTWQIFRRLLGDERENGFEPRIEIKSSVDQELGVVSVEVSDNGVGIPDSDKVRLFEPYFSTKQGSKGGTGLGLAIVSTIVADHEGFIRVRDNNQGGATFIIELPVRRKKAQQSSAMVANGDSAE